MFVGKWNKSVILTYIGLSASVMGMAINASSLSVKYSIILLIIAGICDLFDGVVARKCKRTEEEKAFGIQLDSLVDVISFIAFPISVFLKLGFNSWYHVIGYIFFGIAGVARLGFFNVQAEETGQVVKYYRGLPVTYSALIFPVLYTIGLVVTHPVYNIIFYLMIIIVGFFNILDVPVKKPRGVAYIFFSVLAIGLVAALIIM